MSAHAGKDQRRGGRIRLQACCSRCSAAGRSSSFGLVSGLVVFLLAAVTVTSRYAMQRYVADQVERVPWDLSVYQTAEVPLADKLLTRSTGR